MKMTLIVALLMLPGYLMAHDAHKDYDERFDRLEVQMKKQWREERALRHRDRMWIQEELHSQSFRDNVRDMRRRNYGK